MVIETKTSERVLYKRARAAAAKYETIYGSLKIVLTAAMLAFDELPAEKREEFISEAHTVRDDAGNSTDHLKDAIETLKRSLADAPPGDVTRILSPEHSDLLQEIISSVKLDTAKEKSCPKTG